MNARSTIRKVLFITIWLCIGGGMLTLLLAAIRAKNNGECRDYSITIKGAENNHFIDRNDVEQILKKETNSNIKGSSVSSFNLQQLEQVLEKNTWVSKAELYFDNQEVLHVTITEKEPVARIFTNGTATFYIDSAGRKMPLSDKLSARVPVFTGFPDKKVLTVKDSVLLNDVRRTANYIINDPFWMAQVAQIDITSERTFEMTPVVGNHTVKLGNGDDIDKKFHRLMVFYKQVLSKTGFDKYKIIDVQYEGQVVASKYGMEKGDTAQVRKNVEKLLQQSKIVQNDTVRSVPVVSDKSTITADPVNAVDNQKPAVTKPMKNDKPASKENKQPKAVMPKKPVEDDSGGYN
jgi:cell division protein FtsQ